MANKLKSSQLKYSVYNLPQLCRTNIYVIAIVKISNSSIQNLFQCPQWTSMDYYKQDRRYRGKQGGHDHKANKGKQRKK